jgi:2-polyprenyl-3-methyl-5-hydroxy-6-metoxy-1,4-benzoquinol methylase
VSGPSTPGCSVIERAVLARIPTLGLRARARILDVPCGQGFLTRALLDAGFDAWAADLAGHDQRVIPPDRFRAADAVSRLPWPEAHFDAVVSVEGIEHLENKYSFLREVGRVLAAGGALVITTPNTVSLRSRVRFFGSGFFHRDSIPLREDRPDPLHHINLSTFADLRYALHTTGFRLVHVTHTHVKPVSALYAGFIPWMWIYTLVAFRKEKDPLQRAHNRDIRSTLFSPSLLFGENVMLIARKS